MIALVPPAPKPKRKTRRKRPKGYCRRVKGAKVETYQLKYWVGTKQEGTRKAVYLTFKGSQQAAEDKLADLVKDARTGFVPKPAMARQPFGGWAETWLAEHLHKRSGKTRERYSELLRLHVVPHIGSKPLEMVSTEDLERLYRQLEISGRRMPQRRTDNAPRARAGLGLGTLKYVHRVSFMCLAAAKRLKKIKENPAADVDPSIFRQANDTVANLDGDDCPLTKDLPAFADMMRMVEKFNKPLNGADYKNVPYDLVMLAFDTGARRGELLALQWRDIDLDLRTVSISKAVTEVGNKVHIKASPKNRSSVRTITISEMTADLLRKRHGNDPRALLFPDWLVSASTPMKPRPVTQQFRSVAKRVPGFEDFRFHDLRHACASHMLDMGCSLVDVAAHLGHASTVTTAKVYAHKIAQVQKRKDEAGARRPPGLLDRLGAEELSGNPA